MSKSQLVHEKDVRAMLRLVGELAELSTSQQRFTHLTQGMCQLVCARVGVFGGFVDAQPGGTHKATTIISVGMEESDQKRVAEYFSTGQPPDPTEGMIFQQAGEIVTLPRERIVSDATWYGSEHFNDVRRPLGVDHHLYAMHRLSTPGRAFTIGLHRNSGENPFTEGERQLIDLFHSEIGWVYRTTDRPMSPFDNLSPRLAQVLQGLLQGLSEKQIARAIKLSRYTVHDHVKRLYRRLNVTSRGELMALYIPQGRTEPEGPTAE